MLKNFDTNFCHSVEDVASQDFFICSDDERMSVHCSFNSHRFSSVPVDSYKFLLILCVVSFFLAQYWNRYWWFCNRRKKSWKMGFRENLFNQPNHSVSSFWHVLTFCRKQDSLLKKMHFSIPETIDHREIKGTFTVRFESRTLLVAISTASVPAPSMCHCRPTRFQNHQQYDSN